MKNWGDNVFGSLSVGPDEERLVGQYLAVHDLSPNTRRAIRNDLRKFANWFSHANREPFSVKRVTVRDVTDFKDSLRRDQAQAADGLCVLRQDDPGRSRRDRRLSAHGPADRVALFTLP